MRTARAAWARPAASDLPFVFSGTLVVARATASRDVHRDRRAHRARADRQGARRRSQPERTPLQRETRRLVRRLAVVGARAVRAGRRSLYGAPARRLARRRSSPASRSRWRCCPRSSRSSSRSSWRSAPGGSRSSTCSRGACRRSRRWARPPCCASTRPARSRRTGWRCARSCVATARPRRRRDARRRRCPSAFHELVEFGVLASQRDPFDPMEQAIQASSATRALAGTEHLHPRLDARPRVSAVATSCWRSRTSGDRPGGGALRRRRQGRARGDRRPLSPDAAQTRRRRSSSVAAHGRGRPARARRGRGRRSGTARCRRAARLRLRVRRARRPRRSGRGRRCRTAIAECCDAPASAS